MKLFSRNFGFFLRYLMVIGALSSWLLEAPAAESPIHPWVFPAENSEHSPTTLSPQSPSIPRAWPLFEAWTRDMPPRVVRAWAQTESVTPVVWGNKLLVGSSRVPDVLVLERRSGAVIQRYQTRAPIEAQFVFKPELDALFVGDTEGYLYRFSLDGRLEWEYESVGPIFSGLSVGRDHVYFHAVDGTLVALDIESGEQVWGYRRQRWYSEELPILGAGRPLEVSDLVISGFEDGSVVALRIADGQVMWERTIVVENTWRDIDGDPLALGDGRILIPAQRGPTVCMDAETGSELWRSDVGGIGRPLFDGNRLYLASLEGEVTALDAKEGEILWRWALPKNVLPAPVVLWRDTLIVPASNGLIYILDPKEGIRRWIYRADVRPMGFSSSPGLSDNALYILSNGGVLYALRTMNYEAPPILTETVEWRRRLKGFWLVSSLVQKK